MDFNFFDHESAPFLLSNSRSRIFIAIRADFWSAGIEFPTSQCCACSTRKFFVPQTEALEVDFFKPFKVEQSIVRTARCADKLIEFKLDCVAFTILEYF